MFFVCELVGFGFKRREGRDTGERGSGGELSGLETREHVYAV